MRKDERKGAVVLIAVICVLSAVLWWCGRSSRAEEDSVSAGEVETLSLSEIDTVAEKGDHGIKGGIVKGNKEDKGESGKIKSSKRGKRMSSAKRKSNRVETGESARDIVGDTIKRGD